ncbi:MAG: hypothetical protein IE921_13015 [Rhodobacteraceae bacterium]|nr:hypothetical protein [Paracoccaceae bacterium]
MVGKHKGKPAKKAPISSHPVFPAVVALWFASLFGIGSMVLPAALLEKLVTVTGIASLVPAAAPPLGITARLAIALAGVVVGVVSGLLVARKVIAAQAAHAAPSRTIRAKAATPKRNDRHDDSPAKRPIFAHEELGEDGLDMDFHDEAPVRAEPHPGRRRPLSVTDEGGRSEFLAEVPLPGTGDFAGTPAFEAVPEPQDEPLELDSLAPAEDDELVALRNAGPAVALEEADPAAELPLERRYFEAPAEPFGTSSLSRAGEFPAAAAMPTEILEPAPRQIFGAPDEVAVAARHDDEPAAHAAEPAPEPLADVGAFAQVMAHAAPQPQPQPQTVAEPAAPVHFAATPAAPLGERPLLELGMAELVERFALSLERRKQAGVAAPAVEQAPHGVSASEAAHEASVSPDVAPAFAAPLTFARPEPVAHEPAAPAVMPEAPARQVFAAQAEAAEDETELVQEPIALPPLMPNHAAAAAAPPAPIVPAALRPLDLDPFDDDGDVGAMPDLSLSLSAGARPFAAPPSGPAVAANPAPAAAPPSFAQPAAMAEEPEVESEDEADSDGYSSLLDMKRPLAAGREFVRIDDDDAADGEDIEPVVVFPGQDQRRASPAADGPARSPFGADVAPSGQSQLLRPFDSPLAGKPGAPNEFTLPGGTMPTQPRADQGDTERALRDALDKLQRLSGAA